MKLKAIAIAVVLFMGVLGFGQTGGGGSQWIVAP
jgi:hypothetical protein